MEEITFNLNFITNPPEDVKSFLSHTELEAESWR